MTPVLPPGAEILTVTPGDQMRVEVAVVMDGVVMVEGVKWG